MFLIAKIVRGRRLLHELEQEEKEKAKEKEKEREREREKEALALQLEQQQSTAAAAKRDSSGQGVPPTSAGIRRSRFTSVRKSALEVLLPLSRPLTRLRKR
uniref:Uncharacterized protein n=1 Tax=Ditylenchus dipsaci TaxID=166011 RepID=A0A915ELV7_9BILA